MNINRLLRRVEAAAVAAVEEATPRAEGFEANALRRVLITMPISSRIPAYAS